MSGRLRRLKRLFRHEDGRAILLPIDHGFWYGPMRGIEDPARVTSRVVAGSDGLLVAPGFARAIGQLLPSDRALALRVGATTALSPVQDYEALFAGVKTALRLDADALVHTLYLGRSYDQRAIRDLGRLIESADAYEIPVIAEFLPAGDEWTSQEVAHWARLGFELGASAIKTIYTGDPDSFRQVVETCPVPILIAGGPSQGEPADLLTMVAGATDAGGAGLAIGRRIWQSRDPAHLLTLLNALIHGTMTLEDALAEGGT
jgi:DhnA family fructose-bisphosphate aldolase class Ia